MNKSDLLKIGKILAFDLLESSGKYHIKSDDCDILGYEAGTVKMIVESNFNHELIKSQIEKSCLMGKWGTETRKKEIEIVKRVNEFYKLMLDEC